MDEGPLVEKLLESERAKTNTNSFGSRIILPVITTMLTISSALASSVNARGVVSRPSTVRSPRSPVSVRAQQQQGGGFVEGLINNLTVAIQSSPLAEGKKALAVAQAGSYDEASVKAKMEAMIADNPVMIFSFSTCPFCKNAKKLLDDMNVGYRAVELNEVEGGMAIRAELAKKTGRTSMPNIWIGGVGIGGCNDGPGIMTLKKNGELFTMLEKAGAVKASDPMEAYCAEDPSADECRVYED